ncbi:MAG: peptidoglycan DD-metalloendopeptidase family protein [Xanthomonadales bacterium]|nr:peptidoglycan DD-metalloendopeptidase family protein [Xanthomonadales bacterium]
MTRTPATAGKTRPLRALPFRAAVIVAGLWLSLVVIPGATADNRAPEAADMDRAEAESKLADLLREIGRLQAQLEASRGEQRREQDQLKRLDLQIQDVDRALRALAAQRQLQEQELAALERQRSEYLSSLEQRMDRLAEQLRGAYRGGRQSRMKLVLNQDDPAVLGRMLAYYDYFSRAQMRRISLLREALATLETMQQSIDRELARLAELTASRQDLLDDLDGQRRDRQALLAELAGQIGSEEARLRELERDRQDLEALIERLANVLADIPADLGSHLGVARQKGRLPMPLQGPVEQAFGQSRSGGLHWQGWLIGAEPGTEVIAIAYGRVAFADWLRGYGLLLIIDHGQGFMSLYGHNESLLHEVGAWVEPGETISVVGANPGSGQGLYFELRKDGRAIDPAVWLAR